MPGDWAGASARLLCRNIYRLVREPSEHYLSELAETADGPLPEPVAAFHKRFGGL